MKKPDYAEFTNPKLARVYDSFNSFTEDEGFWLNIVKKNGVKNIVDLGCGTGLLTCELAKLGYKTIGIDPASPMIEIAQKKLYGDKAEWIIGSTEKLEENANDLVIMTSHVSQFFTTQEEWIKALEDIYNALKPGGYILFDSKNPALKPWTKWNRVNSSRTLNTPEGEVESWTELVSFRDNKVRCEIHYLFNDTQEKLISDMELIYRIESEVIKDLEVAGFKIEETYGNWDGSEIAEDSPELIFLARK